MSGHMLRSFMHDRRVSLWRLTPSSGRTSTHAVHCAARDARAASNCVRRGPAAVRHAALSSASRSAGSKSGETLLSCRRTCHGVASFLLVLHLYYWGLCMRKDCNPVQEANVLGARRTLCRSICAAVSFAVTGVLSALTTSVHT